jgi:hypothetical protein
MREGIGRGAAAGSPAPRGFAVIRKDRIMTKTWVRGSLLAFGLIGLFALGCGPGGQTQGTGPGKGKADPPAVAGKAHDHSGWWCDEHGIPEDECSMCSGKVAKECKAKGDWCDLHKRAKSQCFICDPARKEFYAAKYRLKYDGKDPPPIPDEGK